MQQNNIPKQDNHENGWLIKSVKSKSGNCVPIRACNNMAHPQVVQHTFMAQFDPPFRMFLFS